MFGRTLRIGHLAGIPVGVHPLWLAIVALITVSLGGGYYPSLVEGIDPGLSYALGLLSALLLFGSVLLHELGHAVVARRHGVPVEGIDLWLLGGVAKLGGEPKRAGDELRYALAGPAVTVLIAALFALIAVALPASASDSVRAVVEYQLFVNVAILVLNMLPAFPLDGGRVLRALLWGRSGDLERATARAASVGLAFAYLFVALGLTSAVLGAPAGLWFALIGFFVGLAGRSEQRQLELRATFSGHRVGELMSYPAVSIPAGTNVEEAVRSYFVPHRFRSFPVREGDALVGLVTIDAVEQLPPAQRATTPVEAIADSDPALVVDERLDIAELLGRPPFQRCGHAVVRSDRGDYGVVSSTEVERALRAARLAGIGGAGS